MNFRIKILSVFIPLSLLLCFMSNTYSRYVANATGNFKMSFAQWQILLNNEDITNNTSSSIDLTPVIETNDYVESNKIAPSSTGYFDINIDPSNVDVAFNYSISLKVLNENMPDLVITKYAILNNNYDEKDTITYKDIENNLISGSLDLDTVVATNGDELKTSNFQPFTIRICFEWFEGTNELMNDEADTLIASDIENNELKINAEIKFEQKIGNNNENEIQDETTNEVIDESQN